MYRKQKCNTILNFLNIHKIKSKYIVIFSCLLVTNILFASNIELNVFKKETANPIEYATVKWKDLQSKKQGFAITNKQGKVNITIPLGNKLRITVSCMGYKTFTSTIIAQKINRIYLEEDVFNLKQVVVTGHNKPTPIDSSLYSVRIIDNKKIVSSGATSLADLFLTEPNVNMSTDLILGTGIEMFGMSGSNVKIMIDGVPVIGRLNGQIDLAQLAIDAVDHIEIIEGPMSVVYGNNALAGTINIITHKKSYYDTDITISGDAESTKRYNGALDLLQKTGKNTITLSGNYSHFSGIDFDESSRSMDWKPQQQYAVNAGYRTNFGTWNLETKTSVYNSKITMKGDVLNYKVYDSYFYTDRYTGTVNIQGKWNTKNNLSVLLSHSYYNRSSQDVTKDLTTLKEIKQDKTSSQTETNSLLRTVWNHSFTPILTTESGIDFNLSSMEGKRIKEEKQHLNDYAFFANVRYSPWQNFEVQPGVRIAYNTSYNAPLLYSLNAKWNINPKLSFRASVAKGYRAPTVKELYYIFVNSNHEIYGNDNLKAEQSYNYNASIDYHLQWKSNRLKVNSQFFYNDIDNLITLIEKQTGTGYQYNNINQYKTRGGNIGTTFYYKNNFQINVSGIITGRYNDLSNTSNTKKYNTTIDGILGVQIKEPNTQIKINTDLKWYGTRNYFYYNTAGNIAEGNRDSYKILNASINRRFLKNRLNITLGAKNIMNVKTVKMSGSSGGAHTSNSGVPIAYGTSYFIKASFRITK